MNNDLLNNVIPIIIPILYIAIGLYLIKIKGFNQTKVFLTVGALIGGTLGLIISISFKLDIINSMIIIGAFILFGLIILSILTFIITSAQKHDLKRKK
ncbi:hypothetical protein [Alkalihalobacillus sp. AL-G]|uniref:hypothetical protein n=1 Tax=Alkalihalobacillus sp. AL-G TaxID=2926399 RepID=UPI00272B6AEB|nr:hypothetical protein [Alkalihalobacillus sp. AL-G]WLD92305.1 hypothetical protein MOJ78_14955 [Alkalihalobacillus sp. AL-G]